MPGVNCPECGERVKYRADAVKLRCPECGEKFRAPDDDDEEEERPRKKKKAAKKSSNKVVWAVVIVGGLVGIALTALTVMLVVRGVEKAADDSAKVTADNFKKVHSGMTIEEVETILGKGSPSSDQDLMKAFARTSGPHKGKVIVGEDPVPPNYPMEWRRWDASGIRVWMGFLNTKHGPLSAFGVCSDSTGPSYNRIQFEYGGDGLQKRLEDAYEVRMQSLQTRKDAKWVRGAKGQALLLGEWRNGTGEGMVIAPAGKMRACDVPQPRDPSQLPTYRFVNDDQLEITRRPHGDARVSLYDFFVFQDELVLFDVTPNWPQNHQALCYYRMPPKSGGLADTKILQPLIADAKSSDFHKRSDASGKLVRLGKHGLPALRELERTSTEPLKSHFQRTIKSAEARAAEDEKQ